MAGYYPVPNYYDPIEEETQRELAAFKERRAGLAQQQSAINPYPPSGSGYASSGAATPAMYGSPTTPTSTAGPSPGMSALPAAPGAVAPSTDDLLGRLDKLLGGLDGAGGGGNVGANNPSDPGILYQMQQYRPPTLQDYGQNIGRGLNNWLMNSYVTAPSDIYQQTNDAWASQLNANARNQNFNNLLQMMGGMFNSNGNGGSGFRDTHSRQAANSNGSYTTSIDAGGMNPQLAQNAVTAMQNAHPGGARGNLGFTDPQSQHADLRRKDASVGANDLNRMMAQGYAGMEDRRDAGRAGEGTGLMGYNANQRIRNNNQRANLFGMFANSPMFRQSIRGY